MKKSILIKCLVTSLLVFASGIAPATNDEADANRQFQRKSIVGAWDMVVTLRVKSDDCKTAAVVGIGPNPFASFHTFHQGGTLSEFGTRSPPATRGSGHGIWKRVGWYTFAHRNTFHSFDVNGLLFRTANFRGDLTLSEDGQTLTGISRLTFTELSGSAGPEFCATLAGKRITL